MSKFFKLAVSSSESDSEDSDREVRVPVSRYPATRTFAYPSDNDDDAPKRVVRTQKDKAYSELKKTIRQARNARNIKDISKLVTCFETLSKSYEKTKNVMARENLTIPRFYIRYLTELEDFVNEQREDSEAKKSKKILSVLRQKVRKYNKEFETQIETYRADADPAGYSSGAGDEDEEALDVSQPAAVSSSAKKPSKVKEEHDSDIDSEDWKSDSDHESSDTDIDLEGQKMEDLRRYFLKKAPGTGKDKDKDKPARETRPKKVHEQKEIDSEDDDDWQKVTYKPDRSGPLFAPDVEITVNVVCAKLTEIISQRGKKNTDRKLFVRQLNDLYTIADEHKLGAGVSAKILLSYVTSLFDIDVKISEAMDFSSWTKTLDALDGFINLLIENPSVHVSVSFTEEEENLSDPEKPYNLHGSVVLQVKRLDDELTKIFQLCDCHSTDYIDKLKGEKRLCDLIEKAQGYVDSRVRTKGFEVEELAIIYMIRIEHMYYKFVNEPENEKLMEQLCKKIYSLKSANLQRQRALLCQIYHHSLHDRWNKANELLLMSHVQAIVDRSEASTQILYNRAICQLGLCAFRHGYIKEAHQGLSEIHNTQRPKELLAQGVGNRQNDRTQEQETRERSLQVPYHMHINLEVMECVYLVCSMLLEIPNSACYEYDLRRRLLSRQFHYQLKSSERSALIVPPENMREHVVAASSAMLKGDWRKCRDYIINEKMNTKVWNLFREPERVKTMVNERIQKETLRTYLLMYSTVYTTVSFDTLCTLFELDRQSVYSLVSRMIIQEELSATLDQQTNCIHMHRVEPSSLQLLALVWTDKLSQLAEHNEQITEPRGRNYMGQGQWQQRKDRGYYKNDGFGGNRSNKQNQGQNTGQQQNRVR